MDYDTEKIDEAVIALLYLTSHEGEAAAKAAFRKLFGVSGDRT